MSWFSGSGFYFKFNETLINNQVIHRQIESDELLKAEYPDNNNSENTESNRNSIIASFMQKYYVMM